MTAREHAERADRLLRPSSSGMAGSLGLPGPSPVDVAKAHAHAQTAIALTLAGRLAATDDDSLVCENCGRVID